MKEIISSDKPLDTSLNSQASILDEVYRVSLHEENVRTELNTVDLKISKLKTLIEEASEQLKKCSQEKEQVTTSSSIQKCFRLILSFTTPLLTLLFVETVATTV